jgi:hypothetical protein
MTPEMPTGGEPHRDHHIQQRHDADQRNDSPHIAHTSWPRTRNAPARELLSTLEFDQEFLGHPIGIGRRARQYRRFLRCGLSLRINAGSCFKMLQAQANLVAGNRRRWLERGTSVDVDTSTVPGTRTIESRRG